MSEITRRATVLPKVPAGLGQIDALQVLRAFAVSQIAWSTRSRRRARRTINVIDLSYQQLLVNDDAMRRACTWGVAPALLCAGCTFWNPDVRSRAGRLALLIGNASYSIYLTSAAVEEFAYRLLSAVTRGHVAHLTHPGPALLVQVYLLAACLSAGVACYLGIEWPVVHRLQTRFG